MKKYLWVVVVVALGQLFGGGGVLFFVYFAWLFKRGQAHPRWRWPALAVSFLIGLICLFGVVLYFDLEAMDFDNLPALESVDRLGAVAFILSLELTVGSALMVPVYGFVAARKWMRRKGIVQGAEPVDTVSPNTNPEELPEGQQSAAPTGISS